jgi:hypothetical protein
VGKKMVDGFQTTIAFASQPAVNFWEINPKPPGMDGGEAVNTTTMLNTKWRTYGARQLITLTPVELDAAYDPDVYNKILNHLLNAPTSVTVHFPDASTVSFYGFLQKFVPANHEEGAMPKAAITITPTNYDPVGLVEAPPVIVPTLGT